MPELPMDLKLIKEARKREKLSQIELGRIAGVSGSQISRFESGQRKLRLEEAEKIAERLGLPLEDIPFEFPRGEPEFFPLKRTMRVALPLAEGPAALEYPALLSEKSRMALKAWLELMIRLIDPE